MFLLLTELVPVTLVVEYYMHGIYCIGMLAYFGSDRIEMLKKNDLSHKLNVCISYYETIE